MAHVTEIEPGLRLYRTVRSRLVERDITLASIAQELGISPRNIRPAVTGEWNGPRGKAVRELVLKRAGLLADAA